MDKEDFYDMLLSFAKMSQTIDDKHFKTILDSVDAEKYDNDMKVEFADMVRSF